MRASFSLARRFARASRVSDFSAARRFSFSARRFACSALRSAFAAARFSFIAIFLSLRRSFPSRRFFLRSSFAASRFSFLAARASARFFARSAFDFCFSALRSSFFNASSTRFFAADFSLCFFSLFSGFFSAFFALFPPLPPAFFVATDFFPCFPAALFSAFSFAITSTFSSPEEVFLPVFVSCIFYSPFHTILVAPAPERLRSAPYTANTCFPITVTVFREKIHELVATAGL